MQYNLSKMESVFSKLSYAISKWDAFQSILDFALIPHRWHDSSEALTEAHQILLNWPNKDLILEFLTAVADQQPEGFGDPLGEFYMTHLSNDHMGQFFTPDPICDLLAQMNIPDPQPGNTILDPACGSGRTLLAAARLNRHMLFYGADLDSTCCKMAVYNMMLNSLTGEIAHMNSISNEFYRGYQCKTKLVNGHHYPYFIEFTDPNQSRIWLRPLPNPIPAAPERTEPFTPKPSTLPPTLQQGSLF